jgi:general secretion pathway protein F
VGAGIPLVAALSALSEQVDAPKLKSVVAKVRDRVNEGETLADSMEEVGTFSTLYVSMVRAGEVGGTLDQVLVRLADYLESQARLRSKVGSVLIYPAVMFAFAMLVVAALVTVVLPRITDLLVSMNQELPIYTRVIISTSEFARSYWWAVLLFIAAAALALRAYVQTERGRTAFDRFKLSLPVLGRVNRVVSISRFARNPGDTAHRRRPDRARAGHRGGHREQHRDRPRHRRRADQHHGGRPARQAAPGERRVSASRDGDGGRGRAQRRARIHAREDRRHL